MLFFYMFKKKYNPNKWVLGGENKPKNQRSILEANEKFQKRK